MNYRTETEGGQQRADAQQIAVRQKDARHAGGIQNDARPEIREFRMPFTEHEGNGVIRRNAEVSDCALKMKRGKIDQMPVIDNDGRLCGMLFDRVLLKALFE